jgi:hypothetical protein
MVRVVYNACYGGFGLSKEAIQRYWEIKGQQVWIEDKKWGSVVYLVPPEERLKPKNSKDFAAMSMDERIAYNEAYSAQTWYDRNVDRHDPALVQVVEELGEKANAQFAKLRIDEVSGPYRIDEYDGFESVETPGSYDWITP